MTIELVKEHFDCWLEYAKTPNNDMDACSCYHTAHGLAIMATDMARKLGDFHLSTEIANLWDDTYRELFLQACREEWARQ